jgi:hypothetical protein
MWPQHGVRAFTSVPLYDQCVTGHARAGGDTSALDAVMPIVMLTGSDAETDFVRGLDSGAHELHR